MRIVGVAIGALLVGGAVIALMPNASASNGDDDDDAVKGCMNPDATNYNPDATEDDGSCVFADQNDQQDYADKIAEQEREKEKERQEAILRELRANCNDLYNSRGVRQKSSNKEQILELNQVGNTNCRVEQLQALIWTEKEYYIQGETVNLYVGKRFYEDEACLIQSCPGKWRRWYAQSSFDGEELGFKLGVWDEFGADYGDGATITLREWGSALNGANANNPVPEGINDWLCDTDDKVNNGSSSDPRCFSWQRFSFNTANLNIVEPLGFTVKAKIYRGDQQTCVGTISQTKETQRAFTIFPRSCSKDYLEEFGYFESEEKSFESEGREIEQSFQSYISEWM